MKGFTFWSKSFYLVNLFVLFCFAKRTYIKYEKTSGSGSTISCAAMGYSNTYVGVSSDDDNGQCTVIPYSMPASNDPGFTYLEKKKTVEVYEDGWQPYFRLISPGFYAWNIPGTFEVGATLGVHFQLPEGAWNRFHFYLSNESIQDGLNEDYHLELAHVATWRDDVVNVNTYDGTDHRNNTRIKPFPLVSAVTYTILFEARNDQFKVLVNAEEQYTGWLDYIAPVGSARTFVVYAPDEPNLPAIEKLVFTGC